MTLTSFLSSICYVPLINFHLKMQLLHLMLSAGQELAVKITKEPLAWHQEPHVCTFRSICYVPSSINTNTAQILSCKITKNKANYSHSSCPPQGTSSLSSSIMHSQRNNKNTMDTANAEWPESAFLSQLSTAIADPTSTQVDVKQVHLCTRSQVPQEARPFPLLLHPRRT